MLNNIHFPTDSPFFTTVPGNKQSQKILITTQSGARAELYLHGAQLTSWKPAGYEEILFLSEKSNFGPEASIRGGIPVIFPQFADRGSLPKHGFAHVMDWDLITSDRKNDETRVVLRLTENEKTIKLWPNQFELLLTVSIFSNTLSMNLSVKNTGETTFRFTSALHTYFKVNNIKDISIKGLEGRPFINSTISQNNQFFQDEFPLMINNEIDRIYTSVPSKLYLVEGKTTIEVEEGGFKDVVVWNPWEEKCSQLADMPKEGYKKMICIEAGAIQPPIDLNPGQTWNGYQRLSVIKNE